MLIIALSSGIIISQGTITAMQELTTVTARRPTSRVTLANAERDLLSAQEEMLFNGIPAKCCLICEEESPTRLSCGHFCHPSCSYVNQHLSPEDLSPYNHKFHCPRCKHFFIYENMESSFYSQIKDYMAIEAQYAMALFNRHPNPEIHLLEIPSNVAMYIKEKIEKHLIEYLDLSLKRQNFWLTNYNESNKSSSNNSSTCTIS